MARYCIWVVKTSAMGRDRVTRTHLCFLSLFDIVIAVTLAHHSGFGGRVVFILGNELVES